MRPRCFISSVGAPHRSCNTVGPKSAIRYRKIRNGFRALQQNRKTARVLLMDSTFLTIQSRGTLALPPDLRRRHGLDEPGAQVEVVEREDGVIELRPFVAVPRVNLVVLDAADSAFFAETVTTEHHPEPLAHRRVTRRTRAAKRS